MINIESGSPVGYCEWINSCFVQFNQEAEDYTFLKKLVSGGGGGT